MNTTHVFPTRAVEKVWGCDRLPAPFVAPDAKRIGEIWFEPQPPWDALLAKYLFTSEKLSVQVHPDDARAPDGSKGKDECWVVLEAEPDARLAIGFDEDITPDAMRAAALDGSIEGLLTWHPAQAGDVFMLPAGTVHAIGPGLSLVEVQQNSDITYRLYDYGRPRDLHLDAAMAVADGTPHDPALRSQHDLTASGRLVDSAHFTLDLVCDGTLPPMEAPSLLLPLAGSVTIGDRTVAAGGCLGVTSREGIALADDTRVLVATPRS